MVTMKDHHNCCYAGGDQCYYVMDCAIATVEHVMYSSYWRQHLLLSFIPQQTKLPGILLLLLLVTTSVTGLHTTKNEVAKVAAFILVTRWKLCVETTRTASSYGTVLIHIGTLSCHKWPHTLPQWTIQAIGLLVYMWCIKGAVFKRPHVSASPYVALTEPFVARDQKSTNVDCLVLE